jgi:RNA polymerase sigma factor (sigma-70 family)
MSGDNTQLRAQVLVRQYFAGDERLLPELMEIFHNVVSAAARRVVRCNADVEDAVQETWMTFVRHHDRIEDPSRVGAWLWTVSMNNARRIQRSSRRLVATDDVASLRSDFAEVIDFDLAVHAGERQRALAEAVECLSVSDRKLVALFVDERDLDYREISAISGRPVGSLGPTRDRIIRKMRHAQPLAEMLAAS